ncbi:unnamed protein product, partial [Mesorhabditis belari]|uniref:Nematode cuticle collagen N-terminal domain-containing protein n=1 Tax=Mesorhabditis belari TaxID=2138241 RepID=A0AAF3ECT2_9BILA
MDIDSKIRAYRFVGYAAVFFSAVTVFSVCITLPIVYNYTQQMRRNINSEVEKCRVEIKNTWTEVLIEEILLGESDSFSKKVFRKKRQTKIMDQPFNQVENVAEAEEEMEYLKVETEKQEMSAQIGNVVKKVKRNLTAEIKRLSIASSGSLQELTKALLATFPRRKGKITHLPLTLDGEIDIRENQDDVKIDAVPPFEENQLTFTFANLRDDDLSIEVIKWETGYKTKFNGLSAVDKPIIFTDKLVIDLNHSNTQKHFQQCIERYDDEFFPWIEFEFTRKTEKKIYWIIFEWKKEKYISSGSMQLQYSSLWFPRFTDRRPFLGGLVWRNGPKIRFYKGLSVKDFLSVSDVKFDQTMIQFKLKSIPGFNPVGRFAQREPRDKGIRMVVLSNQELNPEQENFCIDKDGETIAITFRNPRAQAWLQHDQVQSDNRLYKIKA